MAGLIGQCRGVSVNPVTPRLQGLAGCPAPSPSMDMAPATWQTWPPYCCAILPTQGTPARIFVEQRGPRSEVAANRLTCWGGKREPGEPPLDCIVRECREEMGWAPPTPAQNIRRVCDLFVDGQLVAWFYEADGPTADECGRLSFEDGQSGVWVDPTSDPRISPWHATVLRAWRAGERRADHVSATEQERLSTAHLLAKLAAKHSQATELSAAASPDNAPQIV